MQQPHHMNQIPRDDSAMKLKRLDEINASIVRIIGSLTNFFEDLSKDKQPNQSQTKTKLKVTKQMFEDLLKFIKKFESDLLSEITGLTLASTGNPHEGFIHWVNDLRYLVFQVSNSVKGSVYGARKDFDLARMRLTLITSQLTSLRTSLESPLPKAQIDEKDSAKSPLSVSGNDWEKIEHSDVKMNGFH